MANVVVGNTAPIEAIKPDPATDVIKRVPRPDLGYTETIWVIPGDEALSNALRSVVEGFASHHSDAPAAWVESDDNILADALARELGCSVGRPDDWEAQKVASRPTPESEVVDAQE